MKSIGTLNKAIDFHGSISAAADAMDVNPKQIYKTLGKTKRTRKMKHHCKDFTPRDYPTFSPDVPESSQKVQIKDPEVVLSDEDTTVTWSDTLWSWTFGIFV